MKAIIHIMPQTDLLDPQGRAIAQALREQGFAIEDARQGKRIEIVFSAPQTPDVIEKQCHAMCQTLLVNHIIEQYRIEIAD